MGVEASSLTSYCFGEARDLPRAILSEDAFRGVQELEFHVTPFIVYVCKSPLP